MGSEVLEQARCLACGYLLRGLPTPVCPECGRRFDPMDPGTYDSNPPARRRRQRLRRAAVLSAILLVSFVLFPRGVLKSTITFTYRDTGEEITVTRWEPAPPRWIRWRYPGMHWKRRVAPTSLTEGASASSQPDGPRCRVRVKVEMPIGSCNGTATALPGQSVFVTPVKGGRPGRAYEATPESAAAILKSMMSPANGGIAIWSR